MERRELPGVKFIVDPLTQAPSGKHDSEEFLDPNQLREERRLARGMFKQKIQIVKENLKFNDPLSEESWNKTSLKSNDILDGMERFRSILQTEPVRDTHAAILLEFCLSAAFELVNLRSIRKLNAIAQQNGFGRYFDEERKLAIFNLAGSSIVKIAGLSIEDVAENEKIIAPSSAFKFLVESALVKKDFTHDKIAKKNKDIELPAIYPNMMKDNIQEAAGQIRALTGFSEHLLSRVKNALAPKSKSEEELLGTMLELSSAFKRLQDRIRETILNPQDSDFNDLKATLEHYLAEKDESTNTLALYMMGLNEQTEIPMMYRRIIELSLINDENSSFYKLFADAIKKFTHALPFHLPNLTEDDLPMFFSANEQQKAQTAPTLDDLKKINGLTFQKSPNKEYFVDPQLINWGNVTPPQDVGVVFSEGGPGKFNIVLHYENETGENYNLNLAFNTRRQNFDWSFLDDPNDPKMKNARNAFLAAAKSILLNVQQQAIAEYAEKHKPVTAIRVATSPVLTKKTKPEPYEPRVKEPKQPPSPKSIASFQEPSEDPFLPSPKEEIERQIIVPQNVDMEKIMYGISPDNQTLIRRAIEEFNQGGAGIFTILRNMRYYDEKGKEHRIYELKSGDFRILITENNGTSNGSPEKKVRTFTILKIQDRSTIFRKTK